MRRIASKPWNISFLTNDIVIEQHADEVDSDWKRRDRAVAAPHYALKDLVRIDEAVDAHLEGLQNAEQRGWEILQTLGFEEPGQVFAGTAIALQHGDASWLEAMLAATQEDPELERGFISALGWLPFANVSTYLRSLLQSQSPAIQRLGIAGFAIHRQDPGIALQVAVRSTHLPLSARAIRASAELGRRDLTNELIVALQSPHEELRFEAAWALARLGQRGAVVLDHLEQTALGMGPHAQAALDMRLRCMDLQSGTLWCRQLRDLGNLRLATIGFGIVGDPALIPELLALTQVVQLARVSGASFADIAGINLDYEDLDGVDPRSEEEQDEMDLPAKDSQHVWPLTSECFAWWTKHESRFQPGQRYLMGLEITPASLEQVLRKGTQRQRGMAALELGLRAPTTPLFAVKAPAKQQKVTL